MTWEGLNGFGELGIGLGASKVLGRVKREVYEVGRVCGEPRRELRAHGSLRGDWGELVRWFKGDMEGLIGARESLMGDLEVIKI